VAKYKIPPGRLRATTEWYVLFVDSLLFARRDVGSVERVVFHRLQDARQRQRCHGDRYRRQVYDKEEPVDWERHQAPLEGDLLLDVTTLQLRHEWSEDSFNFTNLDGRQQVGIYTTNNEWKLITINSNIWVNNWHQFNYHYAVILITG